MSIGLGPVKTIPQAIEGLKRITSWYDDVRVRSLGFGFRKFVVLIVWGKDKPRIRES